MIKGYVTLRPNGLFSVSYSPPVIARVGRTKELDAYITPGDGFGQHRVPRSAINYVFGDGIYWEELETIRVAFYPKGVDCYLTKRGANWGNQYMITRFEPVGRNRDFYPEPGDPLFCGVFCKWFAVSLWEDSAPKVTGYEKVQLGGKVSV